MYTVLLLMLQVRQTLDVEFVHTVASSPLHVVQTNLFSFQRAGLNRGLYTQNHSNYSGQLQLTQAAQWTNQDSNEL